MKLFRKAKDGGPRSTVTGYWLVEIKWLFSIVLLKFEDGSRDEYHSHAFNSLNWVLKGEVKEQVLEGEMRPYEYEYGASFKPIMTKRDRFHRVVSRGTTWVFSLRGPWTKTWQEWDPKTHRLITLTHGRRVVDEP